jgi:hypothetical protein
VPTIRPARLTTTPHHRPLHLAEVAKLFGVIRRRILEWAKAIPPRFPQPLPVGGSIKLFDYDEVMAALKPARPPATGAIESNDYPNCLR